MVQVISNLLGNAIKYSPSGGEIRVRLRDADRGFTIEIQDHGIGLPAGSQELLFEPFGRAPNAEAHQIAGMGLGMYVSRQIAEAHRGRLWAHSDGEGQGSTFTIWLPTRA